MDRVTCPACSESHFIRDIVQNFPCECKLCFHCVLSRHADRQLTCHCGHEVTRHRTTRTTVAERRTRAGEERVQYHESMVLHALPAPPKRKLNVAPGTIKFLTGLAELDPRQLKAKIGKGMLLTEQTVVAMPPEKKRRGDNDDDITITPNAFSAIDMNGNKYPRGEDYDGMIMHFRNFHPNLVRLASTMKTNCL